jgi:single-strand DNA-binding protein
MTNLNRVVLEGNLVRDVEVKYGAASGTAFGSFTIAVNSSKKENGEWVETASYVDCKAFGKRLESCAPHMKKGTKVTVDGHIGTDSWTGKDGQKKSKLVVECDMIYPTWQKREAAAGCQSAPQAPAQQAAQSDFPEDLPF